MNQDRRRFLQQLAAACGAGVARSLGVGLGAGAVAVAATSTGAAATTTTLAGGAYGAGVRGQVFEVIVRQAMAGAPWQEICKGPMQVNDITEDQVRAEVNRRKAMPHTDQGLCHCMKCVKERTARYRVASDKIDSIPHSPVSPCACKTCRAAVNQIVSEIWKTELPQESFGRYARLASKTSDT